MSVSPGGASVASYLSWTLSKSIGGSDQGSFQIIASSLFSGTYEFCMCPVRMEFLFSQPSGSSESKAYWSKAEYSGGSYS